MMCEAVVRKDIKWVAVVGVALENLSPDVP